MRKIVYIFCLCVSLLFSAFPAQAEGRASGNGWYSGTLNWYGASYSFTVSFSQNTAGTRVRTGASTSARITRSHGTVTASFLTYQYGNQYGTGAAYTETTSGSSYSYFASCPYGDGEVRKINNASGRVTLYADSTIPNDIRITY